jgi:polyketide biosynthesis acyl carrier protein
MNSTQILQLIAVNITQIVPGLENDHIERDSMLSPLGLDSIGRVELIERMLEELDLKVPQQVFYSAHNLGELADLFAQKSELNQL